MNDQGQMISQGEYEKLLLENPELAATYKKVERPTPQQVLHMKVGRNEICPCGSNMKFKKCCGLKRAQMKQASAERFMSFGRGKMFRSG